MKFQMPRTEEFANGVVLLLGIQYPNSPTTYTYVLLKAKGAWYATGSGPSAAGWGAILRWLERDDRELAWMKIVTETADLVPMPDGTVDGIRPHRPMTEQEDELARTIALEAPLLQDTEGLLNDVAETRLPQVCEIPACGCSGLAHP